MHLLKPMEIYSTKSEPWCMQIRKRSLGRLGRKQNMRKPSSYMTNVWNELTEDSGGKDANLSNFGNEWRVESRRPKVKSTAHKLYTVDDKYWLESLITPYMCKGMEQLNKWRAGVGCCLLTPLSVRSQSGSKERVWSWTRVGGISVN